MSRKGWLEKEGSQEAVVSEVGGDEHVEHIISRKETPSAACTRDLVLRLLPKAHYCPAEGRNEDRPVN